MPRRLYGRCALLEQIPDLLTQFRAVLVMMNLDRVLNRNFEQFLVRVGRKRHRAIHFARIFATVDEFPSHSILLGRRPLYLAFPGFPPGFRLMLPRFRSPDKAGAGALESGPAGFSSPARREHGASLRGPRRRVIWQADVRLDVRHGRRI